MPGALGALAEQVAQALELRRIGALERIDRLLGIADRKDGARHRLLSVLRARLVRAFAGEEVARQPLDDAPLLRAGVLRLVDQQVIEATVELEQHPGDAAVAREQTVGIVNEVVVVEQTTPLLVETGKESGRGRVCKYV